MHVQFHGKHGVRFGANTQIGMSLKTVALAAQHDQVALGGRY